MTTDNFSGLTKAVDLEASGYYHGDRCFCAGFSDRCFCRLQGVFCVPETVVALENSVEGAAG